MKFDIQAQPLASALDRYGDVTGREVFYDAALAAGRRSAGVQGVFTSDVALQMLLQGTGLSARFMADKSFVLFQLPPSAPQTAGPVVAPAEQRRYYAHIQGRLRDAVCRGRDARAGHFRLVALLWIDPFGRVERYQRLSSGTDADENSEVDARLQGLRLDAPPPAGLAQPVLIMIVPQTPGVTSACDAGDSRLRPAQAAP